MTSKIDGFLNIFLFYRLDNAIKATNIVGSWYGIHDSRRENRLIRKKIESPRPHRGILVSRERLKPALGGRLMGYYDVSATG